MYIGKGGKELRNKNFNAYGLDLGYELETHKHIGKDYGNYKNANKGFVLNLARFFRKHVINKKEQKYKFCNTYSEWKKHIQKVLPSYMCNSEDMLHFLYQKQKDAKDFLEGIKVILIPIYIALLQMIDIFYVRTAGKGAFTIVVMVIITMVSTHILSDATKKVYFFEDLIKIAKTNNVDLMTAIY